MVFPEGGAPHLCHISDLKSLKEISIFHRDAEKTSPFICQWYTHCTCCGGDSTLSSSTKCDDGIDGRLSSIPALSFSGDMATEPNVESCCGGSSEVPIESLFTPGDDGSWGSKSIYSCNKLGSELGAKFAEEAMSLLRHLFANELLEHSNIGLDSLSEELSGW